MAATEPGSGPLTIGSISDVPQAMPGPTGDGRPHGWLGISVGPMDEGAEVEDVTPGGAAEKAGLQNGDLIKRLDGAALHSSDELIVKLSEMPPNRAVSLTVTRKDKDLELKATLSRAPGRMEQDHWGGGPFSDRRWGFEGDTARSGHRAQRLRRPAGRSGRPLRRREHRPRPPRRQLCPAGERGEGDGREVRGSEKYTSRGSE